MLKFMKNNRNRSDKPFTEKSIQEAFNHFQLRNRSENRSDRTLEWYDAVFTQLFKSQWGIPPATQMGEITELKLLEYNAHLQERTWNGKKLKPSSVNNKVRAIRAFFRWAFEAGYTETHLLRTARPPKIPRELIEPLSDEEIRRLYKAAISYRDQAIISLLLDSGLRASELAGLRLGDVNLDLGVMRVMGKGAKERRVPFGETTTGRISLYLEKQRPDDVITGRLFLTTHKTTMDRRNVQLMMRRFKVRADIPRLHAHLLRHTYATRFVLNGGNILLLKACLGHNSLEMVNHYTHLAAQQAIDLGRAYSPLDSIAIGSKIKNSNGYSNSSVLNDLFN